MEPKPDPQPQRERVDSKSTATALAPPISVVIASGAGGEFLSRLLAALREQALAEGAEVIVVDRVGGAYAQRLAQEHPWLTLVGADDPSLPGNTERNRVVLQGRPSAEQGKNVTIERRGRRASVPQLRALGVSRAHGEIVAVIEEHCRPPAGWLRAIRESFRPDDAAIGGPILDDAWKRRRDWVVLFSEYHNYLQPWPDSERYLLNGVNIAYRRSLLEKHQAVLATGYWEVVLHPLLAREGKMRGLQRLGVHHTGPFDYGYYLHQRYLLSRVWGAMQRQTAGAGKRLFYLVAAPLFPFLLLARISARVVKSPYRGQFVLTLPLLVPVAFAYVFGEWSGYAFGFGNALEKVE